MSTSQQSSVLPTSYMTNLRIALLHNKQGLLSEIFKLRKHYLTKHYNVQKAKKKAMKENIEKLKQSFIFNFPSLMFKPSLFK